MKFVLLILRKIWRVLFYVNAALTFLLFFPFFFILLQREAWFPLVFRLKKVWGSLMLYDVGIFYSVKYETTLDKNRAYVFCPNHTSYLDIILSYLVISQYFHSMGKSELKKVPLFNIFFKRMNIAVDRGSIMDSHRAFVRAASDIDKGISISIFPEATIREQAPQLGRFKNGPFKLAIDKQVPIVPITFKNNWKILPDGRKSKNGGSPGIARVVVHKPIETKGMTDDDVVSLRNRVFDIINDTLREEGV